MDLKCNEMDYNEYTENWSNQSRITNVCSMLQTGSEEGMNRDSKMIDSPIPHQSSPCSEIQFDKTQF